MNQDITPAVVGHVYPRAECPYCKIPKPLALGVDAFPAENREEVIQALFEGASFYECINGCGKRWGVVKHKETKSAPMKKSPHLYGKGNRRTRRANASIARRKRAA